MDARPPSNGGAQHDPPRDGRPEPVPPGAELLRLAEMAARLGRQDLREALRTVTEAGLSLTGAEYGAFFYSGEDEHGDRFDVYVLAGAPDDAFPTEVPVRHTALFTPTFAHRGVVRVDDVLADPRYGGNASAGIPRDHLAVRSYLAVPVVTTEHRVLGALLFGHREPGRFDDRAEVAAQAVAAHAGTAAENARLLGAEQRAREQAERVARRLALLQHITAVLSTAASTAEVSARVPAAVTAALGCAGTHLMLVDAVHQDLVGPPSEALPSATRQAHPRVPLDSPLPSARAVAARAPVLLRGEELPATTGLTRGELGEVRAVLAVPVLDRLRRPLGALVAMWRDAAAVGDGLGEEVTTLLEAVAGQVGQTLERARLYDAEQRARVQLAESVDALTDLARTLQNGLLPRRLPDLPRVRLAVRYQPAVSGAEVGGDWYDVIALDDGSVTFVIGDVQGHNTTAAGLMGQLRTAVRAYVTEGHDPATALARTNAVLVQMEVELFATCCLLRLDQDTGEVTVASAGHPPPLVVAGGGVQEVDVAPGVPLGISEDAGYDTGHCRLPGPASLLLYTDGVVESAADTAEKGLQVLREVALAERDSGCDALADLVLASIPHHLTDDAALLVLDYAGPLEHREEVVKDLASDLAAVADARRFVRMTLRGWQVDADVADAAELVTSELVTNAVTHTGDQARLLLAHEPVARLLRITVQDGSTRHPVQREPDLEATGGRGLAIVDVLASSWGITHQGAGKAVWAQLDLP